MKGIPGLIPSTMKQGQEEMSLRQTALGYQTQEGCCKFGASLGYTEFPAGEGYRVRPCLNKRGRVESGIKDGWLSEGIKRRKPSHTAAERSLLGARSCTWGDQRKAMGVSSSPKWVQGQTWVLRLGGNLPQSQPGTINISSTLSKRCLKLCENYC